MKRLCRFSCLLSLLSFLAIGGTAHADTFYFTIEGPYSATGSGYLNTVTDATNPNAQDIISMSGNYDGQTILGLMPCATYDPTHPCSVVGADFSYDNLLYPDGGFAPTWITKLDDVGIGFELQNGSMLDIAANGSHTYEITYSSHTPADPLGNASFSITPTPEPSSFLLLTTGLLGMATAVRRGSRVRSS